MVIGFRDGVHVHHTNQSINQPNTHTLHSFLAGLFGVGGGAVTVPALTLCLGVSHYQALGTSLAAMVPTAVVGTYTHHTHGRS